MYCFIIMICISCAQNKTILDNGNQKDDKSVREIVEKKAQDNFLVDETSSLGW